MPVERLAVVGTGLIGASVGLAAREAGVGEVRGWDIDPDALAAAGERGAVEPAGSLAAAVEGAELAVVAAPVAALPDGVGEVLTARCTASSRRSAPFPSPSTRRRTTASSR